MKSAVNSLLDMLSFALVYLPHQFCFRGDKLILEYDRFGHLISVRPLILFNPLNKDVTVNWDMRGRNPKAWVLKAKEVAKVDSIYAKHIKKALVDEIFNVRGNSRIAHDIQEREFYKEIEL